MEHGENIYGFGIVSSEAGKSEVVVFSYMKRAGGE